MPELSPMPIAECSTPFGIIGIFTEVFDEHGPRFGVLNAFRHHWNLHLGCRSSRPCRLPSAQRLSASLESSRSRPRRLRAPELVLNAFRHHWNLHVNILHP